MRGKKQVIPPPKKKFGRQDWKSKGSFRLSVRPSQHTWCILLYLRLVSGKCCPGFKSRVSRTVGFCLFVFAWNWDLWNIFAQIWVYGAKIQPKSVKIGLKKARHFFTKQKWGLWSWKRAHPRTTFLCECPPLPPTPVVHKLKPLSITTLVTPQTTHQL